MIVHYEDINYIITCKKLLYFYEIFFFFSFYNLVFFQYFENYVKIAIINLFQNLECIYDHIKCI